jgi:two-component system C4-dicarboxylate transport response regulator DctD
VVRGTREISRTRYEIARFRVTVVRGADAPATCESTGVELTIGTEEGNDLRLGDAAVSRHHCVLSVTPHGVELRDLDSTNGTTLAGFRVNSAFVSNGALIGVGETTLRVDLLPDRLASTVSAENRFGPVLGKSLGMRRLFAIAQQVAPSDATILIEGETGTGKGLFAEAIHASSRRADGPFVVVDCAAMPAQLMESELFGHEAGAFTGAQKRRIGKFEFANGGTLFLDEIESMSLDVQVKLLRLLQERAVERVGSNQLIPLDIRVVAATKEDLRQAADQGRFRADLYYRLNVAPLRIPPLRERGEDILLLFQHFAEVARARHGLPARELHPGQRALLLTHPWPGNVRELQNAAERFALGLELGLEQPGTELAPRLAEAGSSLSEQVETFERALIAAELSRPHNSLRSLAEALGIPRKTLHDKLRKHGLIFAGGTSPEDFE